LCRNIQIEIISTLVLLRKLFIFIVGSIYAFCFKDASVMVTAIGIAGGLAGAKAIKGDLKNEL
jgi:hypothetical protein